MTRACGADLNPAHYIAGTEFASAADQRGEAPVGERKRSDAPQGTAPPAPPPLPDRLRTASGSARTGNEHGRPSQRQQVEARHVWTAAVLDASWPPPAATTTPAAILTEIAVTLIAARVKRKK